MLEETKSEERTKSTKGLEGNELLIRCPSLAAATAADGEAVIAAAADIS